jgi:hypothetical protein
MKVSELTSILEQYDPDSDVLISGKPSGYLDFKIERHENTSIEKDGLPIVAIEPTEEIGMIFVTIDE